MSYSQNISWNKFLPEGNFQNDYSLFMGSWCRSFSKWLFFSHHFQELDSVNPFFFFNALITSGHGVLVGRLRSVKAEVDESNKGGDAGLQHS